MKNYKNKTAIYHDRSRPIASKRQFAAMRTYCAANSAPITQRRPTEDRTTANKADRKQGRG